MGFCVMGFRRINFRRISARFALAAAAIMAAGAAVAETASCPGNPGAIGVSRVMSVSAKDHARLGLMQYRYSLPLNDREVVLTFDDGPIPPYTGRALDILASHCTKATFFLVGQQAAAHPDMVLRIHEAGHTIGNHSQNHVTHFNLISEKRAETEIENGNRTLAAILGRTNSVAPFFRVPGLGRTGEVEKYAQSRSLVVWSADAVADDWTRITASQVLNRALARLEQRGKGILLLHDIQPRTVLMLPSLLAELKRRNFKIVHVVPEKLPGEPLPAQQLIAERAAAKLSWPRLASANGIAPVPAKHLAVSAKIDAPEQRRAGKPKKEVASLTFETVGSILSGPRTGPGAKSGAKAKDKMHKFGNKSGKLDRPGKHENKHKKKIARGPQPATTADVSPGQSRFDVVQ